MKSNIEQSHISKHQSLEQDKEKQSIKTGLKTVFKHSDNTDEPQTSTCDRLIHNVHVPTILIYIIIPFIESRTLQSYSGITIEFILLLSYLSNTCFFYFTYTLFFEDKNTPYFVMFSQLSIIFIMCFPN